jgi:GTP cyclohydrolase I
MSDASLQQLVSEVLAKLDLDPSRDDLHETPRRVADALTFLTSGNSEDAAETIRSAVFKTDADEMVVLRDIEFYSLCEHHLLPFYGRAHVAYIPDGKLVGLSKLARAVDVLSRRLQVQERLTTEVATAINAALQPKGVGVVMEAFHLCMMMRGVQKQSSQAVTSCMLGRFKTDPRTRAEFLQLVKRGGS